MGGVVPASKQHNRPGPPPHAGGAIESPPTILVEPELNSRAAIKRRGESRSSGRVNTGRVNLGQEGKACLVCVRQVVVKADLHFYPLHILCMVVRRLWTIAKEEAEFLIPRHLPPSIIVVARGQAIHHIRHFKAACRIEWAVENKMESIFDLTQVATFTVPPRRRDRRLPTSARINRKFMRIAPQFGLDRSTQAKER